MIELTRRVSVATTSASALPARDRRVEDSSMGFERNDSASRFVEALRRLGEETASLVDSSVEQAQHELGDAVDALRDTVTAAIEEAGPDLAAAGALGRKLGYACIGLASLVEEELERRLSESPIADAFRQTYSPERREGRGV